jgi:hypothetical protein
MNPDLQAQTNQLIEKFTPILMNLTFTLYILTVIVAIILIVMLFKRFK